MTLPVFGKCDKAYKDVDTFAYMRFGLYYTMRGSGQSNFCDVHFEWVPGDPIKNGYYSGPKDAMNKMKRIGRSINEIDRFKQNGRVPSSMELTAGGGATLFYSDSRKTTDLWLFGPLVFEGVSYGSLMAELEGLELPKYKYPTIEETKSKKWYTGDPKRGPYSVLFPKDYGVSYHPCTLSSSDYSEGRNPWKPDDPNIIYPGGTTRHYDDNRAPGEKDYVQPTPAPKLEDALAKARSSLDAVFLPKNATKVVWKIEDFSSNLTLCQVFSRDG